MSVASTAMRVAHEDEGTLGEARSRQDLEMLQDILYDMLASGIDAEQTGVTTDEVERFLHEHAREAKTLSDFQAFFDQHGLDADPRTHESAVLELPPITTLREPASSPPPHSLSALAPEPPIELTLADIQENGFETPIPPPPAHRFRAPHAAWIAIGCVAVALLWLAFRGYVTVTALRSELDRASERYQQDRSAIQRLSDQTSTLESNVAATGELVQRVDQKSDVLVDWVTKKKPSRRPAPLPPPAPSE
jgi:hypothetical protein